MSSQTDDYMSIDTPENVAFGYKVAGIGSRFLAALVDTLIILALQVIVILAFLLIARTFESVLGSDSPAFVWVIALMGLVAFLFFWGYYILFEMIWNGQSPGKRWAGLRVIKTDGTPIGWPESVIRNLVRLVDFLPAYYGVGVVTMFIHEQSRRLGDLAAGTIVVYDRKAIDLESLTHKPAQPETAPGKLSPLVSDTDQDAVRAAVAGFPLHRLSPKDLLLTEDFLSRQRGFTNGSALAGQILNLLLKEMDVPPEAAAALQAEAVLQAIIGASRASSET